MTAAALGIKPRPANSQIAFPSNHKRVQQILWYLKEGALPCQLKTQRHAPSGLDVTKLLAELEVPFSPDQVRWRVTNTTNDKKRGQIVPYADSRAYTDRLNALFTPQGWTREYKVETMTNITRVKKGESIVSGKVLVTCTVTILGIGSHSGTGEEWADDDNGMTSADAQAFKRACSCFGLGRYFYDFNAIWVDLDSNRQPLRTPCIVRLGASRELAQRNAAFEQEW